MIYALGNSHAQFFTDTHPGTLGVGVKLPHFISYQGNFKNHQYPHVLAHKFTERHYPNMIEVINSFNITSNDYIMFVVGEIDCRWHFPKKIKTRNSSIEEILGQTMDQFFPAFIDLKNNGYNVLGWGGHPSTTRGHSDDPANPIYGDCLTRNEISLAWSNLLEKKCSDHNMKFISIVRDLIDENGLTKMEYFMDDYHLTPKAMPFVLKKLDSIGITCH